MCLTCTVWLKSKPITTRPARDVATRNPLAPTLLMGAALETCTTRLLPHRVVTVTPPQWIRRDPPLSDPTPDTPINTHAIHTLHSTLIRHSTPRRRPRIPPRACGLTLPLGCAVGAKERHHGCACGS